MGRIVELMSPGLSVHKERGFLAVKDGDVTRGRVPLDDIDAVIAAARGLCWSGNSLAALAERSIPVVLTGASFAPVAHILPLASHHVQGVIMQAQADASLPVKKRLWASIVKRKIEAQNGVLELTGAGTERLKRLACEVRSGDPDNREAAAAQIYWPLMMGKSFSRDRGAAGVNSALNYGYAVLRAAAARAIVAAGLNPSLSIHHVSSGDALRLADDLMEPFRPAVDITVRDLRDDLNGELLPDLKRSLAKVLQVDYETDAGRAPLVRVLVRCAQSLARVYQKQERELWCPDTVIPCAATLFDDQEEEAWDSAFP